jgi:asparagine synthase (glutamine-hydrolysing)
VALSGVGGDEVLGGYNSFARVPQLARWVRQIRRVPLLGGAAAGGVRQLRSGWSPKLVELLAHSDGATTSVWHSYRSLFTDEQISLLGFRNMRPQEAAAYDPRQGSAGDFRLVSRLEFERFLIPQLLRDSDVFTMCHGLELRTPFVDHVFLQGVVEAGAWERSGAASYKAALFEQMPGLVPEGHTRINKKGFVLPFNMWLREELSTQGNAKAADDLRRRLRAGRFRKLVEGFLAGRVHWSRVWALYVLARFKETA